MKSETKKPTLKDLPARRPETVKGGAGTLSEKQRKALG